MQVAAVLLALSIMAVASIMYQHFAMVWKLEYSIINLKRFSGLASAHLDCRSEINLINVSKNKHPSLLMVYDRYVEGQLVKC